jgi:prolycopene isomerase
MSTNYDVIIIGAGIGGLVCGCYLAKAGIKTLIVEKSAKPGGYCTSFKRGGFHFDACVHSLGSMREGGNLRTILQELGIEDRIKITRYDPSDIIISPDFKIHFWNDLDKTIQDFQNNFPKEAKKIKEFFEFINKCEGTSFISLKPITFQTLLDRHFKDNKLKEILSFPLLGNAGLPAKKISALTGILIYKEFMFDGGYYPDGSIQALADALTECFKEFGGDIYFSSPAKKIKVKDKKIESVEVGRKGTFSAKYVISNADATHTFRSLIGKEFLGDTLVNKLKKLEPSLSMFILYLGFGNDLNNGDNLFSNTNVWFLPYYDTNKMYNLALQGNVDDLDCFLVRLLPGNKSMLMLVFAPFNDKDYWKNNKKRLIDVFIKKIEQIMPNLSPQIVYKDAATPQTLFRRTMNYKGASYGWAGIPSQLAVTGFTQKTNFENLYLTGHWTTLVQGVGGVAYLGRNTSKRILSKENRS